MATSAMKHMALNFAKLDNFEGVDFRISQKKMHFLLSSMSVVYVLTTPMPKDEGDNPTVEQNVKTSKELWDTFEAKYMAEDASSKKFLVSCIIDKLLFSWKDFKHTLKHLKEELTLVELCSHLRIEESLRAQDNEKPKGNNVDGPSVVNMVELNNSSRYNDNKGKRKHHDTKANPNKKPKVTCWKCGKPGHLEKDCKAGNVANKANGSGTKGLVDGSSNSLKGHNMFNKSFQVYYVTYVSEAYFVQDGDVTWWVDSRATMHVYKDRCWFKTYESLNDGSILHMRNESTSLVHTRGCVDLRLNIVFDNIGSAFMSTSKLNNSILWHARLGHVHKRFRTDMGGKYMDTLYFQYVGIIHETTAPYTPQQNGISERKNRVLKEMVKRVLEAVVRLLYPKLKTLGEKGIKCIFVGYAEHSKAFRFYVFEPNESVAVNSIIKSRDAMFDENRFSSVLRPSQMSLVNGTKDSTASVVPKKVIDEVVQQPEPELRKRKGHRTPKDFGSEFQLYLIEGTK
ncbi:zinc finger, CCHC-type containing protein, partial [Tanacetum coccineum]